MAPRLSLCPDGRKKLSFYLSIFLGVQDDGIRGERLSRLPVLSCEAREGVTQFPLRGPCGLEVAASGGAPPSGPPGPSRTEGGGGRRPHSSSWLCGGRWICQGRITSQELCRSWSANRFPDKLRYRCWVRAGPVGPVLFIITFMAVTMVHYRGFKCAVL